MNYDYLVIGGYFVLIMAIGVAFKSMAAKSTSDYFRGGGRMLWWMVGSTAFMMQFSAWTFTCLHNSQCRDMAERAWGFLQRSFRS